ncbi:hypothetical protein MTO96_034422 [Rhipicephalus appendiculatus]
MAVTAAAMAWLSLDEPVHQAVQDYLALYLDFNHVQEVVPDYLEIVQLVQDKVHQVLCYLLVDTEDGEVASVSTSSTNEE